VSGSFQTLTIPGFGQDCEIGKPQLPVKGFLLGAPVDAKLSVEILAIDFQKFSNFNIAPTPTLSLEQDFQNILKNSTPHQIYSPDRDVYNSNTFYPQAIAKIGEHGFVRNQYVHQLQIFPIQYNPVTKEIKTT